MELLPRHAKVPKSLNVELLTHSCSRFEAVLTPELICFSD